MFPQAGPQNNFQNGAFTTPSMISQNNSLLGAQPTVTQNQPDLNTTAPLSTNLHPAVQNMIAALKGGM